MHKVYPSIDSINVGDTVFLKHVNQPLDVLEVYKETEELLLKWFDNITLKENTQIFKLSDLKTKGKPAWDQVLKVLEEDERNTKFRR